MDPPAAPLQQAETVVARHYVEQRRLPQWRQHRPPFLGEKTSQPKQQQQKIY